MFKLQTKKNNEHLYDNNNLEKESKIKTKKINYNDYLKLKNAYLVIQENFKKTKEEKDQLITFLQAYQEEINKNEDYKLKIKQSFQTIEKRYTDLFNENRELKSIKESKNNEDKKYNLIAQENNNYKLIIEQLNSQIKQYEIELLNKNKEIENAQNINKTELSQKEELINAKENELNEEKEQIKQKLLRLKKTNSEHI